MKILAIETSCDETAAAIVESSEDGKYVKLLSHSLATSLAQHATTGGIIPENAARAQIQFIIPTIYEALEKSGLLREGVTGVENEPNGSSLARQAADAQRNGVERASAGGNSLTGPQASQTLIPDIDAIAVTYGPGLIGSLLVGVETAKTLSYIWNKPLIPVNHLFGHMYANWIETSQDFQPPQLPAIVLIVSGNHTDLLLMKSHTDITWLGGTRDDAAGECFDKCARLIGYNYPGGPQIAKLGEKGNPNTFPFPRPMIGSGDYDFSFSGLKTAFLNMTKQHFPILRTSEEKIGWQQIILEEQINDHQKQILYDLCASLQEAIVDTLVKKAYKAAEKFQVKSIILSGGVAANEKLTERFKQTAEKKSLQFRVPSKNLCTDNAAMIGAAAFFRNQTISWQNLSANPQLYFD